jgi:hypothetical protein
MLLHFAVPAAVAGVAWRDRFLKSWLILMATMMVDIDHLLADPIYDPTRCSIGIHPLHQYPVMALYLVAALWPKTRLIGVGLLIHMMLDGIDCAWMQYE